MVIATWLLGLSLAQGDVLDVRSVGDDRGKGNVLGVQPWMTTADYSSELAFERKLDRYFAEARRRGLIREGTVVVLPEHIGTWLVALDEDPDALQAETIDDALLSVVLGNLGGVVSSLFDTTAEDRLLGAVFHMKADAMALAYRRTLSTLATRYDVAIIGGSIVLPSPRIEEDRVVLGGAPLLNVALVFRADGTLDPGVVVKSHPVDEELPFVGVPQVTEPPIFETPAGRIGVLICADAWYTESYQALAGKVDLVVVPSYSTGDRSWSDPWPGYQSHPVPKDVVPSDVGGIRERDAWLAYAMPARIAASGAEHGLNVFLRGKLWDLGSDGHTIATRGREAHQGPDVDGAALFNVWID